MKNKLIELSKYFSDDGKCESTVYKVETKYRVVVKTDTGTTFFTDFDSEQRADDYAEDWVLQCQKF